MLLIFLKKKFYIPKECGFVVLALAWGNFSCETLSFLQQGNQYYQADQNRKAITSYRQAIQAGENPTLAWYNMGNAWYQLDKKIEALTSYRMAVTEAPDFAQGWKNLGILYHEMEDHAACIAALEHARRFGVKDRTTLTLLAISYKALENYGQAVVLLEQVLQQDSSFQEGWLLLFDIAQTLGDTCEALAQLEHYPLTGNRYYEVSLLRGRILSEAGRHTEALAVFRECVRSQPERPQAWLEVVHLLGIMEAAWSALLEADRVMDSGSEFMPVILAAGRIAMHSGFVDKAEAYYRRAWNEGMAEGAMGLSNLMFIYQRQGDTRGWERLNKLLSASKMSDR